MNRTAVAVGGIVAMFLLVQVLALALVAPFDAAGYQAVPEGQTDNPLNSIIYVAGILVATGLMLLAFRYDADLLVRGVIALSATYICYYVFSVLFPPVTVVGVPVLALGVAGALVAAMLIYPEWYVIDAAGVVMGGGAAGLFGISFGVLPAIVLLTILAVYDAISVYGTEHMLDLADGVMNLRLPVILVMPLSLSYSFIDAMESSEDEESEDAEQDAEQDAETADEERNDERDAFFIGLGDAVMPTILIASAAHFSDLPTLVPGLDAPLPAVTAAVGMLAGLLVLMRMVAAGRAHAGLPLLNGGAIGGYLLGALAAGIPLVEALGVAPYL
ncbi:MAG: presenilin family intramembrane aspartyl protease PSH [Halobacteriales archaeon]|nr:presenilin family intramembrane aspartyl protease PSH [Halobacteriales archaeon]